MKVTGVPPPSVQSLAQPVEFVRVEASTVLRGVGKPQAAKFHLPAPDDPAKAKERVKPSRRRLLGIFIEKPTGQAKLMEIGMNILGFLHILIPVELGPQIRRLEGVEEAVSWRELAFYDVGKHRRAVRLYDASETPVDSEHVIERVEVEMGNDFNEDLNWQVRKVAVPAPTLLTGSAFPTDASRWHLEIRFPRWVSLGRKLSLLICMPLIQIRPILSYGRQVSGQCLG
jgi:hypothetical protein